MSIVTHSQSELVAALLKSIDKYLFTEKHDFSIVVTENNFSKKHYRSKYPISFILNLSRKGFGANHNAVFERIEPDIFIVVNPDILLIERFDLDYLIEVMHQLKIEVTSPVILNKRGVIDDYKRADLTIQNMFKRKILKYPETSFDWYAGMFLILTNRVYRGICGFDTRFFMYLEDCDFCIRARQNGYKVSDSINTSVQHDARRSSSKIFSKHFYWHLSSLIKYWLKTKMQRASK